ncbi:hypothetical protein [Desulfocurvus vexinensis]|uniref:hypothetical protein n=1 Tax=Desulfocurvus vexinensis TaxID=399548 RepID=UPI00048D7708|nr:hypothetical protein [Desulfocurvus vexinensis]
MSEELTLESLELKKPLDKMTQKELRELCMEKIPMITGASGMSKEELLPAIKEILGIEDEVVEGTPYKDQIHAIKQDIRALRAKKVESANRKEREILRKKINKLKKRTRRLAHANA